MSVVFFPGGVIQRQTTGEIRQQRPSGLLQIVKSWRQKYEDWLKGAGKSIEEGQKLAESKTGVEQVARLTLGKEAGDVVRQATESLAEFNPLKQVTRVAVILIVAMIGVMALLQIMPVNLPALPGVRK